MICLLYQPIVIPDDDSMIDKYRPSYQSKPLPDNAGQSSKNNLKAVIQNIQRDSITLNRSHIFVDSTP
jgi:hypothetical protein